MVAISTIDRFLGSLVGSYIGHYYGGNNQFGWPTNINDSTLYQSWKTNTPKAQVSDLQRSNSHLVAALPWLLYHHDNGTFRHQWLAQHLISASIGTSNNNVDTMEVLYVLGDSLEWMMQCPLDTRHPGQLLCKHLHHQKIHYPAVVSTKVNQWMKGLSSPSLTAISEMPPLDGPWGLITLSMWQCLNYRENLALALGSQKMSQPTLTIIGCLLGAWGGISVIPTPWLLLLSSDSRQAITHLAEQIYRDWAGIRSISDTFETLPLDL
ncbi:hypothetical protein [Leptothoe spongobia]|uniref:ADP-ribosylglycohydrolase n=1 Tax=Leptothoe spongobia TAU-MAC 1115 TaxID=1967444 RepID=A0A947GJ76_9CYAN|nr:hypothetical protein [Leptothoe spongobia]MBT9315718.1 hypothetical protein [Leptothoe spongobia TAU-MAC 1115]